MEKSNRLGSEKSPYLLQHQHNPVHWYAWGEAAFAAAKREQKPIFLSIGYSTCYWCHVMEKDSFEIQAVADVLNQHFISIKVDREERPDVDEIYMDAVVAMTGHGGWPMSVFLTPEGKPFFGGTYFPRAQFLNILAQLQNAWENQREQILQTGQNVLTHFQELSRATGMPVNAQEVFSRAFQSFQQSFDERDGGFGSAPKFPPSMGVSLLLRMHRRTGNVEALTMVTKTLDHMACGGIYDQVGGGFHRYSTDYKWLVPHFEKMLYDNALLAFTYAEAFQVTGKELYAQVAHETLDYVLREMRDVRGGFYSAQDAGEVGREGEFYVWEYEDLEKILSAEEFRSFVDLYGVSRSGNFEDAKNIPHIAKLERWRERDSETMRRIREKIYQARGERVHPHRDEKVLTSWNGLMIAAFAKAYQVFGNARYLQAAQASANFICEELWSEGKLLHRYCDGESGITGMLEDYAYLIHGLLHLYESDFDLQWLNWARELQKLQDKLFWDSEGGGYFTSHPEDSTIIYRKKDAHDGAIPSANSISALNLLRLNSFTYESEYTVGFAKLLEFAGPALNRYPTGHAQFVAALDYADEGGKEIAVFGDASAAQNFVQAVYQKFLPNKVMALGTGGLPLLEGKVEIAGKPGFYICENQSCQLPTNDPEAALELASQVKSYNF